MNIEVIRLAEATSKHMEIHGNLENMTEAKLINAVHDNMFTFHNTGDAKHLVFAAAALTALYNKKEGGK